MLVGNAVGLLVGIAFSVMIHARVRPDVAIALVVGIPTVLGLTTVLLSGRRWVTALGAFILAVGPGWFGVLAALRVISGG